MTPARVVLDTNCVVSALLFSRGSFTWLRHAWQHKQILPLASTETAQELLRVLNYPKFKLGPSDQQALLAEYLPFVKTVTGCSHVAHVPVLRDPFDQIFLQLATQGQAQALVTGDRNLHAIKADFPVAILTPAEFATWLQRH